jgi:hypothetical protein
VLNGLGAEGTIATFRTSFRGPAPELGVHVIVTPVEPVTDEQVDELRSRVEDAFAERVPVLGLASGSYALGGTELIRSAKPSPACRWNNIRPTACGCGEEPLWASCTPRRKRDHGRRHVSDLRNR